MSLTRRKRTHRPTKNATDLIPTPITEAEITAWINQLPLYTERWETAIDSMVRIYDAAEARDTDTLWELLRNARGGKLPKRMAGLAITFVLRDDIPSATSAPDIALRLFFRPSRPFAEGWASWMADNRSRIAGPRRSAIEPEAEGTREEILETVALIGKNTGPRLELYALVGSVKLISPKLATEMLKLAYERLGVPKLRIVRPSRKPGRKGGANHGK